MRSPPFSGGLDGVPRFAAVCRSIPASGRIGFFGQPRCLVNVPRSGEPGIYLHAAVHFVHGHRKSSHTVTVLWRSSGKVGPLILGQPTVMCCAAPMMLESCWRCPQMKNSAPECLSTRSCIFWIIRCHKDAACLVHWRLSFDVSSV